MDRMLNLYDLKEHFTEDGILICFSGPFSHSIIEELGNAVKRYMESEEVTRAALMDVFAVYVEMAQNVRNYARRKEEAGDRTYDFNNGIVVIGKRDDAYVISAGNFVKQQDIQPAVTAIEALRAMTPAELKQAWKRQLHQDTPPNATGAQLGLIDISRKACKPLDYTIQPLDNEYAFFTIRATI